MKIITYNVNGLRSALSKGFTDWLESYRILSVYRKRKPNRIKSPHLNSKL